MVYRIYVEKKKEFAFEAKTLKNEAINLLGIKNLDDIRIINRYDADKLSQEDFNLAINTVFSEPAVDITYSELPTLKDNERVFGVEYLPGQFDQRADSCEQCIQILTQGERCRVRNARIYITSGNLSDNEFEKLKSYLIMSIYA